MLSERLREFLTTWCIPETGPEEVAAMLHGLTGAYYRQWLKPELLAAVRGKELTPELMTRLTGAAFRNEQDVQHWLRLVWSSWFLEPFPG